MALKKRQIFLISLNITFIVGVVVVAFYNWLSKPDSTTLNIKQSISETITPTYSVDLTAVSESDNYVSFERPKGLTLINSSSSSSNSVADFVFTAKDVYSWTLAIDVTSAPNGQISETSAYQYRQDNPTEYIQQTEVIGGQSVVVFTDSDFTDGFSKVAFLHSGNLVATVSLMGDDSSGTTPLAETFNMVLSSWHWL